MTIGSYPEWSVARAREQAMYLKRQIDLGKDPLGEKQAERTAQTVYDLFILYRELRISKKAKRSASDEISMWNKKILPRFSKVRLKDVTASDVERLHSDISREFPVRANRVHEVFRAALNFAVDQGWIDRNPADRIKRNAEEPRHRYLSHVELTMLAKVMATHPETSSVDAIRFILLTGARKGETLKAEWTHLNLENGTWTKPSHHTKQRRMHEVPLSPQAIELMRKRKLKSDGSIYVFPSPTTAGPLQDIRRTWKALREETTIALWKMTQPTASLIKTLENSLHRAPLVSEISALADAQGHVLSVGLLDVHPHDLRHTYASLLINKGASLPIIGALLGHTQANSTMRYAHLANDPLRQATSLAGEIFMPEATKNDD